MQHLGLICTILLIVGGLNWLLVGLMDMNLVTMLFGSIPVLVTVIYVLVGLAAIWRLIELIKNRA